MSLMANPMDALRMLQKLVDSGPPIDSSSLDEGYLKMYDEPDGRKRFSYAKIIDGEIQVLVTFGQEEPYRGVPRYSVNYAVNESHRGRGLAVEAVNKGIEELKKEFSQIKMKGFYIEAIIDVTNTHSIKVAKTLFPRPGVETEDSGSGTPSLLFFKLIVLS